MVDYRLLVGWVANLAVYLALFWSFDTLASGILTPIAPRIIDIASGTEHRGRVIELQQSQEIPCSLSEHTIEPTLAVLLVHVHV